MRTIRLLSFIGIVAVVFAVHSLAQTTVVQPVTQPATVVDIAQQSDCPIQLVLGTERPSGLPILLVKVQNKDSRPIRAYVLVTETGKLKKTSTTILPEKPVVPGESDTRGIGTNRVDRISVSVDHVLFVDGTTWGTDIYGRSRVINAYLEGRNLAISRLKELIGDTDPADFLAPLKLRGSYTLGSQVGFERPGVEIIQRQNGYTEVLTALRQMTKRTAEAQELARNLELMETPAN